MNKENEIEERIGTIISEFKSKSRNCMNKIFIPHDHIFIKGFERQIKLFLECDEVMREAILYYASKINTAHQNAKYDITNDSKESTLVFGLMLEVGEEILSKFDEQPQKGESDRRHIRNLIYPELEIDKAYDRAYSEHWWQLQDKKIGFLEELDEEIECKKNTPSKDELIAEVDEKIKNENNPKRLEMYIRERDILEYFPEIQEKFNEKPNSSPESIYNNLEQIDDIEKPSPPTIRRLIDKYLK